MRRLTSRPALEEREICQNAIDLAVALAWKKPKVAILAAVETVTSKMPATIDAAALCKMADRGQIRAASSMGRWRSTTPSAGRRRRSRELSPRSLGDPDILLVPGSRGRQHARQATESFSRMRTAQAWCWAPGFRSFSPAVPTASARGSASCAVAMLAAHARRDKSWGRPSCMITLSCSTLVRPA